MVKDQSLTLPLQVAGKMDRTNRFVNRGEGRSLPPARRSSLLCQYDGLCRHGLRNSRDFGQPWRVDRKTIASHPRVVPWEVAVPRFRYLCRGLCAVAALASLPLLVGCQQPLAVHDPYFRPGITSPAVQDAEARGVVRYHRALQMARQSCSVPAASMRDEPEFLEGSGRAALAHVCAGRPGPPTGAHGGISNAYRRWVEDQVRELPEAAATAAGAAGGSAGGS